MRRVHLQGGVCAGDPDRFDFELFGRTKEFFVPFFVAAKEYVQFAAFYSFFADFAPDPRDRFMVGWLGALERNE